MLARMAPRLCAGEFAFCATDDPALAERARNVSLGWFNEDGGFSLILERGVAETLGFAIDLPMRRIVLMVNSALDGVGLTAAAASALAKEGIPCNVVAAFRHDHIFAPSGMAERALEALEALQPSA